MTNSGRRCSTWAVSISSPLHFRKWRLCTLSGLRCSIGWRNGDGDTSAGCHATQQLPDELQLIAVFVSNICRLAEKRREIIPDLGVCSVLDGVYIVRDRTSRILEAHR